MRKTSETRWFLYHNPACLSTLASASAAMGPVAQWLEHPTNTWTHRLHFENLPNNMYTTVHEIQFSIFHSPTLHFQVAMLCCVGRNTQHQLVTQADASLTNK